MSTTKTPYEAPAIRHSATLIEQTERGLVHPVEADLTGRDPFGTVGFGV
ncbi:MAG TPA: hypothetical protein VJO52_03820 [Gemmatimonadaceae bacterium]|nr:hypothetical protein [Gemmatimonadaceae bacterium]